MRPMLAILFLIPAAWAQEKTQDAPPPEVVYVKYEVKGRDYSVFLQREDAAGKDLGLVPLKRAEWPARLRATGDGTMLAVRGNGIVEWDREGKALVEVAPKDLTALADAHKLAEDRYLIAARRGGKPLIAEIDAKGAILREVAVVLTKGTGVVRSAWPIGKDRILVADYTGVFEMDWTGKRTMEYAVSGYCYDVLPAKDGNFLVATKGGKGPGIEEITPSGKSVWSARHGCPTALQRLASGNLLVSGG